MPRRFIYDGREFPDPDPRLSVEEVRQQLAEFFPELTNADTREEQREEDTLYTFTRRIGTKGMHRRPDIVAILRRTPSVHLAVYALAAELLDTRGELELDTAALRQPELNLAIAEADAYARTTRQAVQRLLNLVP